MKKLRQRSCTIEYSNGRETGTGTLAVDDGYSHVCSVARQLSPGIDISANVHSGVISFWICNQTDVARLVQHRKSYKAFFLVKAKF